MIKPTLKQYNLQSNQVRSINVKINKCQNEN